MFSILNNKKYQDYEFQNMEKPELVATCTRLNAQIKALHRTLLLKESYIEIALTVSVIINVALIINLFKGS